MFNNWNTAASGNGTPYAPGAKFNTPGANVTLYAQWTASGSTSYVCSDGLYGTNTPCHTTISEAVAATGAGTLIKIAAETHSGGFSLGDDKDLTLQGGWNKTLITQTGGQRPCTARPRPRKGR